MMNAKCLTWATIIIYLIITYVDGVQENPKNCSMKTDNTIRSYCDAINYNEYPICGIGIITEDNKYKCQKYHFDDSLNNKLIKNSSFCKVRKDENPKCLIDYDREGYCKKITCIPTIISRTCYANIEWSSTDSSIEIDFRKIKNNNELIIFYNDDNDQCHVGKTCHNCTNTNQIIRDHFLTCKFIRGIEKDQKIFILENLMKNKVYKFVLIPVTGPKSMGTMAVLTLGTKYTMTYGINLVNITSNKISIKWDAFRKTTPFQFTELYEIKIKLESEVVAVLQTEENKFIFTNLESCQTYCFVIKSENIAGDQYGEKSFCVKTKSDFGEITISPIKSELSTTRIIKWAYNTVKKCQVKYTVHYYLEVLENKPNVGRTSESEIQLEGLIINQKYIVKIRPESENELGKFSSSQTFYTKNDNKTLIE